MEKPAIQSRLAGDTRAMASSSFPTDPAKRRAILVLHQHDIEKCYYEPGAAQTLLDEEAYILKYPVQLQGKLPDALRNILDTGLVQPGAILVQSPFDPDTYEDASNGAQKFALTKHFYLSQLCMHLGAREITVEQIDLTTRKGKVSFDAEGKRLGATVEATLETKEIEELRSHMSLLDEFAGAPPDIATAERLLRNTNLAADPNMRSLVNMRRSGVNTLMLRKLTISLSSESKKNLDVVGRLNVPTFVRLNAEYKKIVQEQIEYSLTVTVRF